MSMDIEREAKEAALAIWGDKVSPHEYGNLKDRARAQGHLDCKRAATEDLLLALCRRVRDGALEEAASIVDCRFIPESARELEKISDAIRALRAKERKD